MTTAEHLISPDGKWFWDGVAQEWKPKHPAPTPAAPKAEPKKPAAMKGLSSFGGEVRSEDLAYGQTVLVWARWILIGTGLLLSFWSPKDLMTLQVQLAAIIAHAYGNFYQHVQLLRGHPALDNVVYAASLADITVVTALVLVQNGYPSPVFIFYFAAIVGISVAFPTWMTGIHRARRRSVWADLRRDRAGRRPAGRVHPSVDDRLCRALWKRLRAQ